MTTENPTSAIDLGREADFALGPLQVRPSRREIVSGAGREVLEPRVMQVLVALVRQRNEVVSRDALIDLCWGGRIVGDDAINACVAKVRRAGETTGAYAIETVPRVGYRLEASGEPAPAVLVGAPAGDVLLAVLPFENLSGDPEVGYFSDGVSEEILHTLAQRAGLKVIGRSSSFQFRGPDKAVANVVRQLGVTHILDGAVRRSGERTRISAQLIDCATQTTVWADRFERELSDIFALQDQVAGAVAQAMRCALAPAVRSGAVDPIAYDLYLRGNTPPSDLSGGYRTQVIQLEEAVQRAPGFADAWASLGYLRAARAYFLSPAEAGVLRQHARAAALHALSLDATCAQAAAAMARATPAYEAVAEHDEWMRKAIAWEPNNATVHRLYARLMSGVGRRGEAVAAARRAYRLDPLDLHVLSALGRTLTEAGEYEAAAEALETARDRWRDFQLLPLWMIIGLGLSGHTDRAREVLAGYDLGPFRAGLDGFMALHFNPSAAASERAIALLRGQLARDGRVTIDVLASAAQRGHLDAAFEIAAAADLGPPADEPDGAGGSAYNLAILFTVLMSEIRRDPRFVDLCERLGLVDYWLETDRWPDCVEEVAPWYDFKAECRKVAEAHPV